MEYSYNINYNKKDAFFINTDDIKDHLQQNGGINKVISKKESKKDIKKESKKESKKDIKKDIKNESKKKSKKKSKKLDIKEINRKDEYDPTNIYTNIRFKIDPIKIIFKYKNTNRKNQYETYIFVGSFGMKYKEIFDKIEDLSLYETLKKITLEEEKILTNGFGDFWMTKFFNIYHISEFVNKIDNNETIKTEILKKYEDRWLINFINKFKDDIIFKKVNYSYSDLVKFQYKIKMGKKLEKVEMEQEDIEDLNFKTTDKYNNILYNSVNSFKDNQKGGDDDNVETIQMGDRRNDEQRETRERGETEIGDMFDAIEETNVEDIEEPELNIEEIEKIYQQDEIDKNLKNTTNLISNILENEEILENKSNYMCSFTTERDNDLENQRLEDAYTKKFVYDRFIFKDDTIKSVRNKITCSIKNHEKFGNQNYIIPSRMYLWSEYLINGKIEKVMLGQRWLKKNELLNIDAEPLQILKYEELDGQIKNLRDTLKRYAGKIRREDEDSLLLYDYENYIVNNEIYMIDIYNELGDKYTGSPEKIVNLTETYFKIYFPKIKTEDIKGIINYLEGETHIEDVKIKNTFDTLYNDLLIEKEIIELVENTKMNEIDEYTKIFEKGNFITQTVIHVNLDIYDKQLEEENKENMTKLNKTTGEFGTISIPKLDLFRIFNDFVPDEKCPFVQYQLPDGQIIIKYFEEYMYEFSKTKENIEMITKWYENSPYGISFKVKLNENKYMPININDIGKVEYKTIFKEEDGGNIEDIVNTYNYVKDLVRKINESLLNQTRKVSVRIPEDWEFRFAFINCIQKFSLPNNKIINHNDFSDFAGFFFPYVALVIEPRKRSAKTATTKEEKSKYGSYLRYKRVSNFDSSAKIEQRILAYIRNYDFEDDILIDEISKQFNITPEKAKEEVVKVRTNFPNVNKLKKTTRQTDILPKIKPPGIGIDIQGKDPEKYKIRISGARDQKQLERIISFMNILMYLYSETYILKKPSRQEIKAKLLKLTNIAKRRNKVDEIVDYQKEVNIVKQMALLDKKRLGFKPEEGQNQYSRSCQNSGTDKKRRPNQTIIKNITELIKKGYVLNKKTGDYERKALFKKKGKREGEVILKAIKLIAPDDQGNQNEIFYTCDPEDNGDHMFVGFLTKSNNPFGECMPCCFKKNRMITKKKETLDFYKRCMGKPIETKPSKEIGNEISKETVNEINNIEPFKNALATGDILYILQDTNKIQENRISYLPKFIDYFTNIQFDKNNDIKNHYLLKTDGYYFKYGIKQENYSFLNTLETILGITIQEIKNIIIEFLTKDIAQQYYYSLNDGDIRAEYQINDFKNFIRDSEFLDYYYLKDLLKIKGLFTKNGIFPMVITKMTQIIKQGNERDKMKEDFFLDIDKTMIDDYEYCLEQLDKLDVLFMIKDGKYYYPIVEIIKPEINSKSIEMKKLFNKDTNSKNLINELQKYFLKTVQDIQIDYNNTSKSAKATFIILKQIAKKNKDFDVISQVVDSRFKCKYLITKNNTIIPVIPSGIVIDIPIICFNSNMEQSMRNDCFSKLIFNNLENTNINLENLYELSNHKLNIKPIGVFYDMIDDNNMANIIGIISSNDDLVPILPTQLSIKDLENSNIRFHNRPLYHILDQKLTNYNKDNFDIIDNRIKNVNLQKYKDEAYELFRYELSNLINIKEYSNYKKELKELIKQKDVNNIQDLILKICVNKINDKSISTDIVGAELVKIINDTPNIDYYKIDNERKICSLLDENKCSSNPHCSYHNGKCSFGLTQDYLFEFIKKISIEVIDNQIKAFEILREKRYFVSDIVDLNNFTERAGQKIIKSTNTNLEKILMDMFGKEHIPKIGRRYIKKVELDLQVLKSENPLKDIKDAYKQSIIPYNYSILRAYCSGYYWIKHSSYTLESRNLGFYSELQNEIINIFRSQIIDWLNIPDNIDMLENLDDESKNILKNNLLFVDNKTNKRIFINTYIIELMEKDKENNLGLLEIFILNKIHNIPVCLYINGNPKFFIDDKVREINDLEIKNKSSIICINAELHTGTSYPYAVDIIYYK
jgi:hypothetical protein